MRSLGLFDHQGILTPADNSDLLDQRTNLWVEGGAHDIVVVASED